MSGAAKVATHDILHSGLKVFVYKSDGERAIVGTEARGRKETEERCGSDRGAVRGERSRRESGQRSGRAGNLGDRVDDEDARARSPGVP